LTVKSTPKSERDPPRTAAPTIEPLHRGASLISLLSDSRWREVVLRRLWWRKVTTSTALQRLRLRSAAAAACGWRRPLASSSSTRGRRQLGSGRHCGEGHSGGRRRRLVGAHQHLEQAIQVWRGEESARAQLRGVRRGGIADAGARVATRSKAMKESPGAGDGYRGVARKSEDVLWKWLKCRFYVSGKMGCCGKITSF
jgi:hypothetical protein